MRSILVCALVLSLAGCTKYVRPGVSEAEQRRDTAECEYDADRAVAGTRNGMIAGWDRRGLINQCMALRGYHLERR